MVKRILLEDVIVPSEGPSPSSPNELAGKTLGEVSVERLLRCCDTARKPINYTIPEISLEGDADGDDA